MGEFKSQHYVPKVYLRNFSDSDHRKTICLYNIVGDRLVCNAPIKSQCASNYLYGADDLEHHLSDIEGKYASWVSHGILADPPIFVRDVDMFLQFFISIQYMRTAAQIARMQASMALMVELSNLPDDHELRATMSDTEVARMNVSHAVEMRRTIVDLRMTLLRNQTLTPFLTCDNPVILTNRLHVQRLGRTNFGLGNAGAILYFPLSPKFALLLYDKDVYSVDKANRIWTELHRQDDIHALNKMMYLNANENLYFNTKSAFSPEKFEGLANVRVSSYQNGRIMQKIGEDEAGSFYAEVDDRPETDSYIIGVSQAHPLVDHWPRFFRFRQAAFAYDNSTAAGLMRAATVPLGGTGFKKIAV